MHDDCDLNFFVIYRSLNLKSCDYIEGFGHFDKNGGNVEKVRDNCVRYVVFIIFKVLVKVFKLG